MERKRLVHQLDTPYSTVQWPQVPPDDLDTILELLCSLLSPVGVHRRTHTCPSRGKRDKSKQKAQRKSDPSPSLQTLQPPPPEVVRYIDVGLSSVTRALQDEALPQAQAGGQDAGQDAGQTGPNFDPSGADTGPFACRAAYAAIFVARSGQASTFHCHFPQMVAAASEARPGQPAIRLIGFSSSTAEARLSESLGIPRVSCVALRAGSPLSQALVDLVREKARPVEVPWLKEAKQGHRETKIKSIQTTIGPKKQRIS